VIYVCVQNHLTEAKRVTYILQRYRGECSQWILLEYLYKRIFMRTGINVQSLTPIWSVYGMITWQQRMTYVSTICLLWNGDHKVKGERFYCVWNILDERFCVQCVLKMLYNGYMATIYREVPAYSVYFSSYYYFKDIWTNAYLISKSPVPPHCNNNYVTTVSACSGALAGVLSWMVIYPIDVAETPIQLNRYYMVLSLMYNILRSPCNLL
jgi:hypothetical protein